MALDQLGGAWIGMLLFAVTGLTLNHAAKIEAKPEVQNQHLELPAELLGQLGTREDGNAPIRARRGNGWIRSWASPWRPPGRMVGRRDLPVAAAPGGDAWLSIDRETGAVEYESTSRARCPTNDLHKGRNAGPAGLVPDLFAVACLVPASPACSCCTCMRAAAHDLAAGRPRPDDPAVDRPAADPLTFLRFRPPMRVTLTIALSGLLATSPAYATTLDINVEVPKLNVAEYHRPYVAGGRRRPEGRGQPVGLVPADQQQRRPWHQVAARPAPVVAQERPHPAGAGGRRDRPDPPGRQARAVVQRQAAGTEAAGPGNYTLVVEAVRVGAVNC